MACVSELHTQGGEDPQKRCTSSPQSSTSPQNVAAKEAYISIRAIYLHKSHISPKEPDVPSLDEFLVKFSCLFAKIGLLCGNDLGLCSGVLYCVALCCSVLLGI